MVNSFRLSRQQIAKIVGNDPEAIKQFEKLFSVNQEYFQSGEVDSAIIEAGSAGAQATQALGEAALLDDRIEGLEMAPPSYTPQLPRHRYGSFCDTTDQIAALANTAYGMTFNTTELSHGVTVGSPTSRIYVDTPNIYNIQFSAQIDTTVSTDHLAWIWLRKNNVDVPSSASQIRTKGNNYATIAAWNFLLQMNAGDYFELMWAVDDVGVFLNSTAATALHPAIPSVILTVTNNINAEGSI